MVALLGAPVFPRTFVNSFYCSPYGAAHCQLQDTIAAHIIFDIFADKCTATFMKLRLSTYRLVLTTHFLQWTYEILYRCPSAKQLVQKWGLWDDWTLPTRVLLWQPILTYFPVFENQYFHKFKMRVKTKGISIVIIFEMFFNKIK